MYSSWKHHRLNESNLIGIWLLEY
uniref:Uncharacterized protein n=1 Tax=Rhizophora mucronata TaxID=61149 RepID=A0A2P2NQZ4_RHIMU